MADCHICRSAKAVSTCHQCKRLVCANCAPTGICSTCAAAPPTPATPPGLPQHPPPRSPYATCKNVLVVAALCIVILMVLVGSIMSTGEGQEMGVAFLGVVLILLSVALLVVGFLVSLVTWLRDEESGAPYSFLGPLLDLKACCSGCLSLAMALLGGLLLLLLHLLRAL